MYISYVGAMYCMYVYMCDTSTYSKFLIIHTKILKSRDISFSLLVTIINLLLTYLLLHVTLVTARVLMRLRKKSDSGLVAL